jgi:hypothetical protein
MTNQELLKVISTEVDAHAREFSLTPSRAFLVWLGQLALQLNADDAYAAAKIDGSNDKGIDFFFIDEDRDRVVLIQGKYASDGKCRPKMKDFETLLGATEWLESPELLRRDGKPELAEAADEYLAATGKGFHTELWFVFLGPKNPAFERRAGVFNSSKKNRDRRLSCQTLNIDALRELYNEQTGPRLRVPKATLSIDPALNYPQSGAYGKALVATIPGESLANLYAAHGDRLFDRDVRLFLGAQKGSINAGILDTLTDKSERERFWAYNNGVTIVCDSFEVDPSTRTLELRNFSIVNGCQTTVSLAQNAQSLNEHVQVLLKIVSPPEAVIDPIIRYTNSQNQIKIWDIFAQDRNQRRLQRAFGELKKPYFYILRRGERLSTEQRKKFRNNGARTLRTIKHDQLAQFLAAFKGNPWAAYREKSLLFTKYYEDVFPGTLRAEEALFIWLAGEKTTSAVHTAIRDASAQQREERVKILKRGGLLFALGCFGLIANMRNSSDFLRSIEEERITSKTAADRLSKYAKMATIAYADAARNLIESTGTEIGILVRSKDYFQKISDRIKSQYETWTVNPDWLKGALPKLF